MEKKSNDNGELIDQPAWFTRQPLAWKRKGFPEIFQLENSTVSQRNVTEKRKSIVFFRQCRGYRFSNCTLRCPVTLKLANQNRYFY